MAFESSKSIPRLHLKQSVRYFQCLSLIDGWTVYQQTLKYQSNSVERVLHSSGFVCINTGINFFCQKSKKDYCKRWKKNKERLWFLAFPRVSRWYHCYRNFHFYSYNLSSFEFMVGKWNRCLYKVNCWNITGKFQYSCSWLLLKSSLQWASNLWFTKWKQLFRAWNETNFQMIKSH